MHGASIIWRALRGEPDAILLLGSYSPARKPNGKQVIAQIVTQLQSRYTLSGTDTSYVRDGAVVLAQPERGRWRFRWRCVSWDPNLKHGKWMDVCWGWVMGKNVPSRENILWQPGMPCMKTWRQEGVGCSMDIHLNYSLINTSLVGNRAVFSRNLQVKSAPENRILQDRPRKVFQP